MIFNLQKIKLPLKIISFYLKRYRKEFVSAGVLTFISAVASAVIPFVAGKLIDSLVMPATMSIWPSFPISSSIVLLTLWVTISFILNIVSRQIANYSVKIDAFIESDYTVRAIEKLLQLPISFHKSQKIGEVFNKMERAAGLLAQIIGRVVINLTPEFLSIVVALVIAFVINYIFAAILLAATLLYASILFQVAPNMAALQRKMHRSFNQAYGDAYDTVTNIQTVKQASAERYEMRRHYKNFRLRSVSLWLDLAAVWRNLDFYQRVLVSLTQAAIFALSILFIQRGTITIGELVMFNGYAAMFFGPFVILGQNLQNIQNGLIALERAEKIIQIDPEPYQPRNAVILDEMKGDVEFKNISFKYNRKGGLVLNNINFIVRAGTTIALVGESGVGKTTLTDLISLYYRPAEGKIFVDGHDITKVDLNVLRSQIAVVPQEVMLFNDTVKNNIKYGTFGASDAQIKEAAKLAHADEFIESFPLKYKQVVGERGIKLSTGQKQRIAIARAMLRDPRILILDEPTSALDAVSEKFIQESLDKLMKGRTTFIIAHRLSTVKQANIILVLDRGKIIERGTHDELVQISGGAYRRLYELQIGMK